MAFSSTRAMMGAAGGGAVVPSSYLDALLYAGTDSSNARTGAGDQPDLVWIKARDGIDAHVIIDDVRGISNYLSSNSTNGELAIGSAFTSIDSDGFTVATNSGRTNDSNKDYVGWCLKKDPDMFDIVTYSGNGSNQTIAHSLNTAAEMYIVKRTDTSGEKWFVYHKDLNGGTTPEDYNLKLNLSSAEANSSTTWNSTAPTSSVFSVGQAGETNSSGGTYVAYLFTSFAGACKVGVYTGTGSSGNSVSTGFRPRFIMLKGVGGQDWQIWDSQRGNTSLIDPSSISTENTSASNEIVDSASGFTVNGWSGNINSSSVDYVYVAFS